MKKKLKISIIFFGLFVISIILHNVISGVLKIEEPAFFVLTFLSLLGLIISVILGFIPYIKKK